MKNTFKAFGLMLLAGTLMLASCGKKNENTTTTNPVTGKPQYTITAQANNAEWGTVAVNPATAVDSGASVTLTATANAGYNFVNWTMPNGTTSTNNPLVVVATANETYTANFTEQAGVKTTFGSTTWDAGYVNGLYYSAQNALIVAVAQTSSTSYPQFAFQYIAESAITTGTVQGSSNVSTSDGVSFSGPQIWYYENEEDFVRINYQDGSSVNAGDWWDKTMTLNITAFDATAPEISFVINATMGKVNDVLDGATWAQAEERSLTVNVAKQSLVSSKKNLAKKDIVSISK